METEIQNCFAGLCFISLAGNAPKFFGFAVFFAVLAIILLAWTLADVPYTCLRAYGFELSMTNIEVTEKRCVF